MKRKIIFICLIASAISLAAQGIFALVQYWRGEKIESYFRFHEVKGRDTSFNWFSLAFFNQIESQRLQHDILHFIDTVHYPIAQHFQVTDPYNKAADTTIADSIYKTIMDSVNRIRFSTWGNWDWQAFAVRRYEKPRTISTAGNRFLLSMFGTASPEAAIVGFNISILPGHYETQNRNLARNRLSRSKNILLKKLSSEHIFPSDKIHLDAKELQLTYKQVDSVRNGHTEILDRMRFVTADVTIITNRVVITPLTTPWLLFLWIALGTWLSTLRHRKTIQAVENKNRKPFNWRRVFIILGITLGVILITIGVYYFWKWILFIIAIISLVYLFSRPKFQAFLWLLWIFLLNLLRKIRRFFEKWWPRKPFCQVLVITWLIMFFTIIIFLIGIVFDWWHIC